MGSQVVQSVLKNITLTTIGITAIGGMMMRGIDYDSFLKLPDAIMGGISIDSKTKFNSKKRLLTGGLSITGGVEVLKPFNSSGFWAFFYIGGDISFTSHDASGLGYGGAVYSVKKSSDYEGWFFVLSFQASKLLLGRKIDRIPGQAAVFSGGEKGSSYGWAVNRMGTGVSGSLLYYFNFDLFSNFFSRNIIDPLSNYIAKIEDDIFEGNLNNYNPYCK